MPCSTHGGDEKCVQNFSGKRTVALKKRRRIWETNIELYLRKVGFHFVDWIHLAQDATGVGSCERGNEPSGSIKSRKFVFQLSEYQLLKLMYPW